MKRTFAWLAGIVGIAALGRWLARRGQPPESAAEPTPDAADPAQELRQRLDEQRQQPEEDEAPKEPAAVDETLEERRARVHAKAREAIDSMDDEGPAA